MMSYFDNIDHSAIMNTTWLLSNGWNGSLRPITVETCSHSAVSVSHLCWFLRIGDKNDSGVAVIITRINSILHSVSKFKRMKFASLILL